MKDEQLPKHLPRMFSLIKNESWGLEDDQIMHRDIKLENIMISYNNDDDLNNLNLLKARIKIIDFGSAIKGFGRTILGSELTMDPFIINKYTKNLTSGINEKLIYDLKVDIWSIGAVCYQMATGKTLFNPSSIDDLSKKVEEGTYTVPTTLSREIISFLICMLQYESEKRLSVEELAAHPFLTKNIREFRKIDITKLSKYIVIKD